MASSDCGESSSPTTDETPQQNYESARSSLVAETSKSESGASISKSKQQGKNELSQGQEDIYLTDTDDEAAQEGLDEDQLGHELEDGDMSDDGEVGDVDSGEPIGANNAEDSDQFILMPIGRGIAISKQKDRTHKDKKIYFNHRTGLPVRPPTSFGLFKHALRRKSKESKVNFTEFNKMANEEWKKLSQAAKERYSERSRMLNDQFKKIEVACLRRRIRQLQQVRRQRIDEYY